MKCSLALSCLIAFLSTVAAEELQIVEKGPHHRVFETVKEVQTAGRVRLETNQVIELQGGLHRWTDQGWVTTDPKAEVFGDHAVVRNLAYGAIIAGNLATPGALDFSLPDGQRLTGHLVGLVLTEGNRSVLIAEVKDCTGAIGGPDQNEITFADAFTDFSITVKYILQRDRISQNLILQQQLPSPVEWGLTEDAVLEVLTEFTAFPDVYKEPSEAFAGLNNERISFASMEFLTGRAFSLGDEAHSVLVAKSWDLFEGQRSFLVEKIPWKSIAPELANLPPVAKEWRKKENAVMARSRLRLPPRREARAALKPIQSASIGKDALPLASASPRLPGIMRAPKGYLIDFELVSSVNSNLWKGDTTYYVSGSFTVKTNVFEGGCVIKFAPTNTAKLSITGPITCLTTSSSPAILTARDDHSVGEKIGNNTLSGVYANTALDLNNSGTTYDLHDVRISHASTAVQFFGGRTHGARNVQITQSDFAAKAYQSTFYLYNALFYKVGNAFSGAGTANTTGNVQHVTFNRCGDLNSTTLTLYMTNSILGAVTNITSFTGAYNGTNSDPSAIFVTLGAGGSYLTTNSSFRDAGTTNIDSSLLSSLKKLTTYPPIIAAELTTLGNTNLTLSPQAGRDSDTPDLGWHYAPIDYCFGGVNVTNSTITVNAGTTIALYSPTNGGVGYYGISLGDGGKLFSEGSPTNLNRIVRYNCVQEQSTTTWNTTPVEHIATASVAPTNNPELRVRFTEWFMPANDTYHFRGYNASGATPAFTDCQLHGGQFYSGRPTVNVTNCLFNRVALVLETTTANGMSPTFRNCLLYGGTLRLSNEVSGTWTFKDNVFDKVSITQSASLTHDYNGYITNASGQWLTASGSHDTFTNSFGWQNGALGRWYQPADSIFIGSGSTNADLLGLYHYTVLTNDTKETTSVVDRGFHYVATTNGVPIDTDGDGIADYLEDANGNGSVDSGETDWQNAGDGGLKVLITRPRAGRILP